MNKRIVVVSCVLLSFVAAGCGARDGGAEAEATYKKATAYIVPRSDSEVGGAAIFIKEGAQVTLQVTVESASPGEHAVHIHETGDCSAPDASSAGGHWNPAGEDHGAWGTPPHHLGDLGNITVGEDGTGSLNMSTDRWAIGGGGDNDIIGKAVVVHAVADDLTSQPSGAAGARVGCGVINPPM